MGWRPTNYRKRYNSSSITVVELYQSRKRNKNKKQRKEEKMMSEKKTVRLKNAIKMALGDNGPSSHGSYWLVSESLWAKPRPKFASN